MDFSFITTFYEKLQDEESREIFNAKIHELYRNDLGSSYIKYLSNKSTEWKISDYDNFINFSQGKKLIIRGAGAYGEMTFSILKSYGIDIECFCDNSVEKQRTGVLGKKVISESELMLDYRDRFVIIASRTQGAILYGKLLEKSFPRENIFLPRIGSLYATNGMQYFDCPGLTPMEDEVFLDCGCFDGGTSEQFSRWNKDYKKIIAFEPDKNLYPRINSNCKLNRFVIYPYATGSKREETTFEAFSDGGSRISKAGNEKVIVESIDNVLEGDKATFIKLDVEGAELETLKGAVQTIKKYKPRLAISIYHKPQDIFEIPLFLEKLEMNYKYYIRHYTSCMWETILYAI